MAETIPLLESVKVGAWQLASRMAYAPLTRCRALGNVTQEAAALYYSQRAHKGMLMLTEATTIAPQGYGYPNTPGIHTKEQTDAWKPVVKAVHEKGAIFLCQLWHVGRVSHTSYQPDGAEPVSASAIEIPKHKVALADGSQVPYEKPRALRKEELPGIIEQYVQGAKNALEAGFDGVEVHSANGYLLDSYLKESANQRTDEYGGSVENRCRFPLEVIKAVAKVVGPQKTGVRFSPFYVMAAEDPHKYSVFTYMLEELHKSIPDLAYVHMVEPRNPGGHMEGSAGAMYEYRQRGETLEVFRNAHPGTFLVAGGHTRESGINSLKSGHADVIVYGRTWLANPDLPLRFELDAPLNPYDRASFYSPDQVKGYTDYPFLTKEQIAEAKRSSSPTGDIKAKGAAKGHADEAHMGNAY